MRCGHLCFLFCIVMSSTIDVVLKLTSFQIDPFQMAFWRFLLGGLFCLPVALHEMKKQGLGFSPSFLLPLSLSGFLCVVLSTGFHQTAIASGKASVVSVLYCCSPLFVTAAARCMLKERISKSVMLSCALYLTSMAVILANQAERTSILSCVFTLLASVLFAVYNVLGQRWVGRFPPVVYVTFSFLFGSMELLAVIGLSHQRTFAELARANGLELLTGIPLLANLSGAMIPALLYIGIVATGLNYLALQITTRDLSAITASLIFYFKLILSPLLAWAILGEDIHFSMVIAIVLIFGALLVSALGRRRSLDHP